MTTAALINFLADCTSSLRVNNIPVSRHTYIVGGAVRNKLLGLPAKDIDIVIDSVSLGQDSAWLAEKLKSTIPADVDVATNQYGVAIVSIKTSWLLGEEELKGEVIEIANARKESYGGVEGKGYKPHLVEPCTIHDDLVRREFTVNTLMWCLEDIHDLGIDLAPVLDLTERGLKDLEMGVLVTPQDPVKTFSDDPTRILRAVKFESKYPLVLDLDGQAAIKETRNKLQDMPWDAVRKILVDDILKGKNPSQGVVCLKRWGLVSVLREMMEKEPGFAAAFSRETKHFPVMMCLEFDLDFGWPIRHPLSVLTKRQRYTFRANTKIWSPEEQEIRVEAIIRPPIEQCSIFEKFGLEGKERAIVAKTARGFLVSIIDFDEYDLQDLVETKIQKEIAENKFEEF